MSSYIRDAYEGVIVRGIVGDSALYVGEFAMFGCVQCGTRGTVSGDVRIRIKQDFTAEWAGGSVYTDANVQAASEHGQNVYARLEEWAQLCDQFKLDRYRPVVIVVKGASKRYFDTCDFHLGLNGLLFVLRSTLQQWSKETPPLPGSPINGAPRVEPNDAVSLFYGTLGDRLAGFIKKRLEEDHYKNGSPIYFSL